MQSTLNSASTSRRSPPSSVLLDSLNAEQQAAVLATEGPTIILAGAGTGKTRVIAYRVAHLLQAIPGLAPDNILGLTFSRKAAEEMLERVEGLCGSHADEMAFFTFHGFCHRFLQEHAIQLGFPAHFRLLDQTESWVFFRKILPDLRLKVHWNLADPPSCIEGFLRFISRAKDELLSPAEYAVHARALEDPRERERAREVARVYDLYQERMRAAGNLDFGDLIAQTIQALRDQPALLQKVRAQYRYIQVDEFQDTNVAQIELLKLLAGPSGNLCVVGDDDQAIYRFRGASFASFWLMKQAFPGVRTLRLTCNYRATPTLLEVTNQLIRHNGTDRYDPQKLLWTANPDGPPVEVMNCQDELREASAVIERIRQLYQAQPVSERRWDRMVVLYRAHAHRDRLVEVLRETGIPFSVRGGSSLFERSEIKDLIAFLRVLQDPSDSVSLFRLLAHPVWAIPVEDLLAVGRSAKERDLSITQVLGKESELNLAEGTRAAFQRLLKELAQMRGHILRAGIEQLVPQVAEKSFLKVVFRLPTDQERDPLIWLGRFLRLTYRYAQNYTLGRDLASFLWYLDSVMRAPNSDFSDEEEVSAGDCLRLMTVHQAKGLEFDWVILLGLVQGRFPARGRSEPVSFPVELMKEPLPEGDYHLQEERRLCYVACTRARRGLILMTQDRARHRPSLFVGEILEAGLEGKVVRTQTAAQPGTEGKRSIPSAWLEERRLLELLEEIRSLDPVDGSAFEQAMQRIRELVGSAIGSRRLQPAPRREAPLPIQERFSFSQLETYRYCPLKYVYAYIYRIPVRSTPQMFFGIDLHDCLETFYAQIMQGRVVSLQKLLVSFQRFHAPGRYGEPYQDKEYQRLGRQILSQFYRKHEGSFGVPLFVERPFALHLGDVLIQGIVDRVDPLPGGGVEVIDYKSGRPKEEATSDEQLQLRLYALAAKEVFQLEPRRVSFYYLRENRALSFEQRPEDYPQTQEQILGLVQQIRAGHFTPVPSTVKCRRCDFRNLCPASLA